MLKLHAYPSLLHNWNVLKRRDELNLRHLQVCETTPSLHDHRDVHNRKSCTCGTSEHLTTGTSATLSKTATLEWNTTVFCTSGPQHCLHATGMKTALSKNCTPIHLSSQQRAVTTWPGTAPAELPQFSAQSNPSTCSCTTTGMSTTLSKNCTNCALSGPSPELAQ